MVFKFFSGLSQNYCQLLDNAENYDVIIKVGENQNTKEFHVHSIILKVRSIYFKRAFSENWIVKKNNIINFEKPNISPTIFQMIIGYIYAGILDLDESDVNDILDLLIASDELLFAELVIFVQTYLIDNHSEWLQQNFVKVLHAIFQIESFKQLQDYCLDHICNFPEVFFNLPDFPKLEKRILLELLKREDIQIEEIELWNYLVKWGIAQTSELREKDVSDSSSWNVEDFMALKNTLNQIIPHIRFFEIPSKDFYLKVWPFKKVLPQAFVEDILSFHMTSALPNQITLIPRHGRITVDSTIINSKHTAILNNWIQREDANAKISNVSKYDFTLIYRGSRDGLDSNPVICSCKGGNKATLLIIKISDDDETILGGYNPIGWKYNNNFYDQWASTSESFIFSFKRDLTNAKISRVLNGSKAIYESSAFKFNFGNSDLVVNHKNKSGTCKKRHYESSILDSENFMFEEMEVFRIFKSKQTL